MAEYRSTELAPMKRSIDWGAIWGGVFCFLAIFAVFGALGLAIFASVGGKIGALSLGMEYAVGAWSVVLTIIAMYVGGRATGRLGGFSNQQDGAIHGLIMFGLSLASLFVLASLGGGALSSGAPVLTSGAAGVIRSPYVLSLLSAMGWSGFVALILGMVAALSGASSAAMARKAEREVREIRPAA